MMPAILALFEEIAPRLRAGQGVRLRGYGGSFTVEGDWAVAATEEEAAAVVVDHPFLAPDRAGSSSVIVAGSVNGNLVTGSPMNISGSGTVELYIRVTITLTISANGYVADEFDEETAWIYQTGGSVPACTSSHFYVPVATYVDGVKTIQHRTTNISLRPRDDGTGTSTPTAFYWRA